VLHCDYTRPACLASVYQMAPPRTEFANQLHLTTHLSTPKGWKAELALLVDLYLHLYPHKWSPVTYRSSAEWGKFAGQRPTFYGSTTVLRNQPSLALPAMPVRLMFADVIFLFNCRPCHSTMYELIATRIVALIPSIRILLWLRIWWTSVKGRCHGQVTYEILLLIGMGALLR